MKRREYLILLVVLIILLNFIILLRLSSIESPTGYASAGGIITLFVQQNPLSIYIHSPKNQSYFFPIGSNYSLDLNVSSEHDYSSWYYKLEDLRHNTTILDYTLFNPNISFEAVRGSNRISIMAKDGFMNTTQSVIFFIQVPNLAPFIYNVSDYEQNYACEGTRFSYRFLAIDEDEDILNYGLSPYNPFYIREDSKINLNSTIYEIFSNFLFKRYVGRYIITFYVTDNEYTDFRRLVIEVIEVNNPPEISSPGVQTLWILGDNSTFNYQMIVNDLESGDSNSGNLSFNISFSQDFLFNISSNGTMYFQANESFIGVHNISVCVKDNGLSKSHINQSICGKNESLSSCTNFSITVTEGNRPPTIISHFPINQSLYFNNGISFDFNITKYDPDGTIPDSYWYVNGERVLYSSGNNNDSFHFFSLCGINHYTVRVDVSDGILNDSLSWIVSINPSNNLCNPISSSGGGGGSSCNKKVACGEWDICKSLDFSLKSGEISGDFFRDILKNCLEKGIPQDFCGFQKRNCTDIANCLKPSNFTESIPCYYVQFPNCYDGIKNCHDGQCEILVDCGGPCISCPSCFDGIQNGKEEGIDCGGQCSLLCKESPSKTCKLWFCCDIWICIIIILIIVLIIFTMWMIYKVIKIKSLLKDEK